jgi:hypothetical protein
MRASFLVLVAFVTALLHPAPVGAQQDQTRPPASVGAAVPAFSLGSVPQAAGPTWRHRLLTAVGGAALGAGVGFFASQIARGDWDDGPGQPQINRASWAAVGGSLGLAAGLSFPLVGRGPPEMGGSIPPHLIITAEEMEEIVAMDAYEAVEILRPQWLVLRPASVIGEPAQQTLPVYLDDFRLGDADDLRGLSVQRIESIRLVSAAIATARWGVGNSRGAIQVVTRGF